MMHENNANDRTDVHANKRDGVKETRRAGSKPNACMRAQTESMITHVLQIAAMPIDGAFKPIRDVNRTILTSNKPHLTIAIQGRVEKVTALAVSKSALLTW